MKGKAFAFPFAMREFAPGIAYERLPMRQSAHTSGAFGVQSETLGTKQPRTVKAGAGMYLYGDIGFSYLLSLFAP